MNTPATSPPPPRLVSAWWRTLSLAFCLLCLVGGAMAWGLFEQAKAQIKHLQSQVVQAPRIGHLAVLLDEERQAALLVTADPVRQWLQIERLNGVEEGREQRLQLWALQGDAAPRSLGLLERKLKTAQLPLPPSLGGATELAISVEGPDGATRARTPQHRWLYRGWWVAKAL